MPKRLKEVRTRIVSPTYGEVPPEKVRTITDFMEGRIGIEEYRRRMRRNPWVRRKARETGAAIETVVWHLYDEFERGLVRIERVEIWEWEWVQFLATILVRCEYVDEEGNPVRPQNWRHIEIRGIFECITEDLPKAIAGLGARCTGGAYHVLREYFECLDYGDLLEAAEEVEQCDLVCGFEEIQRFWDVEDRKFKIYLEVWDMDYGRIAYQHVVENVPKFWVDFPDVITDPLCTTVAAELGLPSRPRLPPGLPEEVVEAARQITIVSKSKVVTPGKGVVVEVQRPKEHIEEVKGVKTAEFDFIKDVTPDLEKKAKFALQEELKTFVKTIADELKKMYEKEVELVKKKVGGIE